MFAGRPYNRFNPLTIESALRAAGSTMPASIPPHLAMYYVREYIARYGDYIKPLERDNDIVLEVECGDNRGYLYLSRFCQGSKGPCIFFEGMGFLTPNQFQCISGRESAKDWKRSIRHQGKSLKLLLSKGIPGLSVHASSCTCDGCRISSPVDRRKLSAYNFRFGYDSLGQETVNRSIVSYKSTSMVPPSGRTDSDVVFQEDIRGERRIHNTDRAKSPIRDISESSSDETLVEPKVKQKRNREHMLSSEDEIYSTKKRRSAAASSFSNGKCSYIHSTGKADEDPNVPREQRAAQFLPLLNAANSSPYSFGIPIDRVPFRPDAGLPSFPATYMCNPYFTNWFSSFGAMHPEMVGSYSKSILMHSPNPVHNPFPAATGGPQVLRSSPSSLPVHEQPGAAVVVDSLSSDTSGSSSPSTLHRSDSCSTENSQDEDVSQPLDLTLERDVCAKAQSHPRPSCGNPPVVRQGLRGTSRFDCPFPSMLVDIPKKLFTTQYD